MSPSKRFSCHAMGCCVPPPVSWLVQVALRSDKVRARHVAASAAPPHIHMAFVQGVRARQAQAAAQALGTAGCLHIQGAEGTFLSLPRQQPIRI